VTFRVPVESDDVEAQHRLAELRMCAEKVPGRAGQPPLFPGV